jgi:hypothetical protein
VTFNHIVFWLSAWTVVSVLAGFVFGLIMRHKGADQDAPEVPEPATRT